jgi:transposase
MPTQCISDQLEFEGFAGRRVIAAFDGGAISSDAGALLPREADWAIGLLDRVAACFDDRRQPDAVVHAVRTLVGQRIVAIACGYEDVNDHDQLRFDPVLSLFSEGLEAKRKECAALAGKSTVNRLEHAPRGGEDRYHKISHDARALEYVFVDVFLDAHAKAPKEIVLDLDATDDPLHGYQEGRFFYGYYNCYCYLPLYVFCGPHLLAAKLRRADIDGAAGAVEEIEETVRSYGRVDSDLLSGRVELFHQLTLETTMDIGTDGTEEPTAIRTDLGAIFISMELSRSSWLITSLSPGNGAKMSKHVVRAGDVAGLLERFSQLREKAQARTGRRFPIIVIQEAGLDGFWIHRVLQAEAIESYIVDPASIATSRRRRRAKTDKLDGETLVRTLLAYKRGEPRVCAMVQAPSREEEDRRRITRERKTLTQERVQHVNRIKGLLFAQGISGYEPLRRDRRQRLEDLRTGDGRALPTHLKAQISRELDRLELLFDQIKAVEAERDALLSDEAQGAMTPAAAMLLGIKGIGPECAAILWSEGLFRRFNNRRQVAAYAGLAPTAWQSGSVDHEQGVSKSGNPRLRTTIIQLAWLWLRHQPGSELSRWFRNRVERNGDRLRKTMIVALARKLLIALWKYVTAGIVIEGAAMKAA